MLKNKGLDWEYFPNPAKSLFISYTLAGAGGGGESVEALTLNFVSVSRYLGAYFGPQAELEAWVKPQVEAWAHKAKVLAKIARRHPQSAYAGLGMLLQSEWQYLQRTVPGVGTLID